MILFRKKNNIYNRQQEQNMISVNDLKTGLTLELGQDFGL